MLVGYGRVGRRIASSLTERGIPFVVIEQTRETVEQLRREGLPAVAGDASEAAVLIQGHIARAAMLVIATPDTIHVRQMVEIARMINPRVEVVVRTHNDEEAALLERDGIGTIFMGEHELATGMTRHIVERMQARA